MESSGWLLVPRVKAARNATKTSVCLVAVAGLWEKSTSLSCRMSVSDFRQNYELMEVCHLTDTLSNPGSGVRPWSCTMHHGTWVPSISAGGSVQGGKAAIGLSCNRDFTRIRLMDPATECFSCVDSQNLPLNKQSNF